EERPLGLAEISLTGGFWAAMQATNAAATLPHCQTWLERLGWLSNFDRVAGGTTGPDRPGLNFSDSEAYKLLEALCGGDGRSGRPPRRPPSPPARPGRGGWAGFPTSPGSPAAPPARTGRA